MTNERYYRPYSSTVPEIQGAPVGRPSYSPVLGDDGQPLFNHIPKRRCNLTTKITIDFKTGKFNIEEIRTDR